MEKHTKYMAEALKEAKCAFEKGEVPIGAVVVCSDQIIARAHNLTESLNDPTAHAEMQAITAATSYLGGKYLTQCTLYVTLEPCCMCAGALFGVNLIHLFLEQLTLKEDTVACQVNCFIQKLRLFLVCSVMNLKN